MLVHSIRNTFAAKVVSVSFFLHLYMELRFLHDVCVCNGSNGQLAYDSKVGMQKTMNGIDLSFGKQLPYMNQHADIKNKTIDDDRDHLETGVT